jgi:23S rRNA (adenine2503-C2)-methyltransferase
VKTSRSSDRSASIPLAAAVAAPVEPRSAPPYDAVASAPSSALLGLTRAELAATLAPYVDRPYRAAQVYEALHRRWATDWEQMTELGKGLRAALAQRFTLGVPRLVERHVSADGTRKYLFGLEDGATIETVDIPDRGRHTVCLSSQAGCALACRFCVTGYWGAGRNLTAAEIVGQVQAIAADEPPLGESLNLVFMGMGEPLHNLEQLRVATEVLSGRVSWRRITVSTAGVVPGIAALAGWERRPNLAVSLHAPDDERRGALMPINRTYPLALLLEALRAYPLERGRRLTFEYILIRDFNDRQGDADALVRLLRPLRAKVNLIPANPDPVLGEAMVPPAEETVLAFQRRLLDRGLTTTVRRRRGDDVAAACGQLRAPGRAPRGFRQGSVSL